MTMAIVRDSSNIFQTPTDNAIHLDVEQELEAATYETADRLSKMSISYSQSGDLAAALDARQKAVEVYRLLHTEQPTLFEGNLARELLGLSKDLAGNGRIEEAFKASQESGMLYRHILGASAEYDRVQNECQDDWGLVSSIFITNFARILVQIPKLVFYGIFTKQSKPSF
ncbi:unnamed protein product [Rhizoctonia solani]|uniref:Uncharacterized protein n=1 Tax=Rhizoctonia solani TaxID=456999 RepID=A0A8H2XNQ9_9AGAM|nr:unnamed protein product [Rhizoctonia solani]